MMKWTRRIIRMSGVASVLAIGSTAAAQTTTEPGSAAQQQGTVDTQGGMQGQANVQAQPAPLQTFQVGAGAPPQSLPPPRSDNDPTPMPAAPTLPGGGVTEQAGVGGTQAYGRAGVLELGGSAGISAAAGTTILSLSPSVGWFFVDNLQLSGIFSVQHANTGAGSATNMLALVEPSYHLPITEKFFVFGGLGVGAGYVKSGVVGTTDPGLGLALAPRLGVNILVGRSGILTPAATLAYSSSNAVQTTAGQTLIAVSTSFGANIGYTVMW